MGNLFKAQKTILKSREASLVDTDEPMEQRLIDTINKHAKLKSKLTADKKKNIAFSLIRLIKRSEKIVDIKTVIVDGFRILGLHPYSLAQTLSLCQVPLAKYGQGMTVQRLESMVPQFAATMKEHGEVKDSELSNALIEADEELMEVPKDQKPQQNQRAIIITHRESVRRRKEFLQKKKEEKEEVERRKNLKANMREIKAAQREEKKAAQEEKKKEREEKKKEKEEKKKKQDKEKKKARMHMDVVSTMAIPARGRRRKILKKVRFKLDLSPVPSPPPPKRRRVESPAPLPSDPEETDSDSDSVSVRNFPTPVLDSPPLTFVIRLVQGRLKAMSEYKYKCMRV
jgi:hypothetical protein